MITGCLGEIEFIASSHDLFTFRDMEFKRSVNFGEHAVMTGLPRLQHTGRALDTRSLPIVMDAALPGATPCAERIAALNALAESGEELPLVLGVVYAGLWVITGLEVVGKVQHGDLILRADLRLELKEYH